LSRYTLYQERTSDIVELLRFTCQNTRDYDDGIDQLRSLVADYVVCHVEAIAKDQDFLNFVQERGAVAKDLLGKAAQAVRLT